MNAKIRQINFMKEEAKAENKKVGTTEIFAFIAYVAGVGAAIVLACGGFADTELVFATGFAVTALSCGITLSCTLSDLNGVYSKLDTNSK